MATKTSVVMDTVDQAHKQSSRSITYIDPNASNSDIKNFVEGLNGLTHQTLAAARRVDSTDIINDTRLTRNLTMSQSSIAWNDISTQPLITTIEVTGTLTEITEVYTSMLFTTDGEGNIPYVGTAISEDATALTIALLREGNTKPIDQITFIVPETATYAAATFTLTIT